MTVPEDKMNDAAFVAANQATNDYLQATLLVTNHILRVSLMRGGVRDMALLLRKPKAFIHALAVRILKRPGAIATTLAIAVTPHNFNVVNIETGLLAFSAVQKATSWSC